MLFVVGCSHSGEFAEWQPLDSGVVYEEVDPPEQFATGLSGPVGIVWWQSQLVVAEQDAGRVVSVDSGTVWAEGLAGPTWLAAHGERLLVADAEAGSVLLLDADGTSSWLSTDHATIGRIALTEDYAWWLDPDVGELWRADLITQEVERLTNELDTPVGLAVVDDVVWVAEQETEQITMVHPETGLLSTVVELEDPPYDLVRDGDEAFVSTRSTRWPYGGFILSVVENEVRELSYSPPEPERIVFSDTHVIWASKQSITRVEREGGSYVLVAGMTAVEDLIVQDDHVFWTDGQTGEVLGW